MRREDIQKAAAMCRQARRTTALTGAGVSAESGLRTFRDAETGHWAKYDPMELAHIDAFRRDPALVTRWYHERFTRAQHCDPNAGHIALAAMQRSSLASGQTFCVITQNVDGLHQRGGAQDVIELHGTILTWRCTQSGKTYPLEEIDFTTFPPVSEEQALLRPNVVWFGEQLPEAAMAAAQRAAEECDLFISIGTSGTVWPAADLIETAQCLGAATIEINPATTPITHRVDLAVTGNAAEVLPAIADELGIALVGLRTDQ